MRNLILHSVNQFVRLLYKIPLFLTDARGLLHRNIPNRISPPPRYIASVNCSSVVAESSLAEPDDNRFVKKPLSPTVTRQIGLAVLDQRQAAPAALAFIKLAQRLEYR